VYRPISLAISCAVLTGLFASAQVAQASDALPTARPDAEANKKVVLGFYKAVSRFDFEAARPFIGDFYIQHSPMIEDGVDGLKKALDGFREEFKGRGLPSLDVRLIVAEGDYVAMLSQVVLVPGSAGIAVGDLFRLQDGKLVEHWDITERLAQKGAGLGMFDAMDKPETAPGKM
jgi:predicted SnoaL-like aldol condensation-catalyzing enzyme